METNHILPGKVLVLPATDLVLDIYERIQEYAKSPGQALIAHALTIKPVMEDVKFYGINRVSIAELVVGMYLDEINSRVDWSPYCGEHHHFDRQWARMVEGWENRTSKQAATRLFNRVFRPAYDAVDQRVTEFIHLDSKESNWNVWYGRRHGLDVMVEKGPDFRILDWERRMRVGYEYKKSKDEGDAIPPDAWLPDADADYFKELLSTQQAQNTALGQSSVDAYEAARKKEIKRRRPTYRSRKHGQGAL